MADDPPDMSGKHLREEISARADGEDPGVSDEVIDAHLESCESCREFADATHALQRRLAMVEMPVVEDHYRDVVDSIVRDERRRSSTVFRWALAICALIVIAAAVPDFMWNGSGEHSLRHIAAFRLAYGAGLLGVVARPARARTMFYVSIVLVIALVSTFVIDLVGSGLDLRSEALHLVQVLTAMLLWLLARPPSDASEALREPLRSPSSDSTDEPTVITEHPGATVIRLHEQMPRSRPESGR